MENENVHFNNTTHEIISKSVWHIGFFHNLSIREEKNLENILSKVNKKRKK